MLTKQDLNAIGNLIDTKLEKRLTPLHDDIKNLQEDMTTVKDDVKKLDKRLTKTINFFDNAETDTRSKVNKTRRDLGLNEVEFAY